VLLDASTESQTDRRPLAPSVRVTSLAYKYAEPRALRSIRDVDFRNLRVVVFDAEGKPAGRFPLRNGLLERSTVVGGEDLDLGDVYYFKGAHNENEKALVELSWLSCGGSCSQSGYLLVFELRRGELFAIQQITYDLQAPGALDRFFPQSAVLTVLGRTADDSPHCCPKSLDEVTFDWTRNGFQVRSVQRLLLLKSD